MEINSEEDKTINEEEKVQNNDMEVEDNNIESIVEKQQVVNMILLIVTNIKKNQYQMADDAIPIRQIARVEKHVIWCTLKLLFLAREEPEVDFIKVFKQFFKQLHKVGDNKAFIDPWYDSLDNDTSRITTSIQIPSDLGGMNAYILRFYTRKGVGKRTEYLKN